ncbi:hypothetical protein ACN4EG_09310 [Alkalinema pantanalense CENA528]|uniref:hypothetical protein n=1 Tax=Alkalinema pantanalense TaxID=1620705 RepID=UPI003D6E7680
MQSVSQPNHSSEPPRRPLVNLCGGAIALLTLVSPLLIIADSSSTPSGVSSTTSRLQSSPPASSLLTPRRS